MSDKKMKGTSSETSSHHESNTSSNYSISPTLQTHTLTHTAFQSSLLIKKQTYEFIGFPIHYFNFLQRNTPRRADVMYGWGWENEGGAQRQNSHVYLEKLDPVCVCFGRLMYEVPCELREQDKAFCVLHSQAFFFEVLFWLQFSVA